MILATRPMAQQSRLPTPDDFLPIFYVSDFIQPSALVDSSELLHNRDELNTKFALRISLSCPNRVRIYLRRMDAEQSR